MEAATYELEMNFVNLLGYAESFLGHISHQISVSKPLTNKRVYEILGSFSQEQQSYNALKDVLTVDMFYWIDANDYLIASTEGLVPSQISLSKREYLSKTKIEPWKIHTGRVTIGAMSGQYVLPAAIGVLDARDEYLGTAVVSFQVRNLMERFKQLIARYKIDFAILDENSKMLMESEEGLVARANDLFGELKISNELANQEMISDFSPLKSNGRYVMIRNVEKYPYKILVSYKNNLLVYELFFEVLPHLIEFLIITIFFATIVVFLHSSKRKNVIV